MTSKEIYYSLEDNFDDSDNENFGQDRVKEAQAVLLESCDICRSREKSLLSQKPPDLLTKNEFKKLKSQLYKKMVDEGILKRLVDLLIGSYPKSMPTSVKLIEALLFNSNIVHEADNKSISKIFEEKELQKIDSEILRRQGRKQGLQNIVDDIVAKRKQEKREKQRMTFPPITRAWSEETFQSECDCSVVCTNPFFAGIPRKTCNCPKN